MGQNNTAAPVWAQLFLPVKEEPMNRYSVIHGKNPREILLLREEFAAVGTALKIKTGVETFDCDFRERVLCKGIAARDPAVIACFRQRIYPDYIEDARVDILMNNTDFGVGGEEDTDAQ